MQRRPAPLRARLRIAHQLDRLRLRECRRHLLALTATAAIHHDEARTTPIDTGEPGPLKGQPGHRCLVASPVATPGRSASARKPLRQANYESAPERIRTSDLRFRRRFGSGKPTSEHRGAKKAPENQNRDRFRPGLTTGLAGGDARSPRRAGTGPCRSGDCRSSAAVVRSSAHDALAPRAKAAALRCLLRGTHSAQSHGKR
jgi:hypothetical protein